MATKEASLILRLKDLASAGLVKVGESFDSMAKNLDKSKFLFGAVAAGLTAAGTAALMAAGKMQQWRISFTTMLGSASRADELLGKIREFAASTPFELPQVVEGTKRLLAYGIEAENVIDTFKVLGDITSGIGMDKLPQLVLAFGQVKAATKLTGQELRQFTEAGVPLIDGLAKHFGIAESAVRGLVETGKVGFKDVEAVLKSMTSEGGRFANGMAAQMNSLSGVISNVKDSIFILASSFGDILLPPARWVAEHILKIIQYFTELSTGTKVIITGIAALAATFTGLLAGAGALVALLPMITAAFAVLTGPIALTIAGILGLVAAIVVVKENFIGFRDFLFEIFLEIGESVAAFAEAFYLMFTGKFMEAYQVAKDGFINLKDGMSQTFSDLASNAKAKFNEIINSFKTTNKGIETEANSFYDRMLKRLHKQLDEETEARIKQDMWELELRKQKMAQFESFLNFVSTLQSAKSKELAAIGKAAAISEATINTYRAAQGAYSAMAGIPIVGPALGAAAAALAVTAGLANVARISGVQLAEGGVVMPRPGGTQATIGEAGSAEAVIPLDDDRAMEAMGGLGGPSIVINAGTIIADEMSIREFAEKIDEQLFRLQRNKRSVAF